MRLKTKLKIKNIILAIITSVIAIFIPSFLLDKYIEGVVFFFCHWLIREQYPLQYHCTTHAMCRLVTSIVFFFGVTFVLPISLSLLSAIPICYFISWVGFSKKQANVYEIKYTNLKNELEKHNQFSTDTCTEEELINRCKELHLSEENTNLAIEFFIKKTKQSIIADKLCVGELSVAQRKARLKQKLNKQ